MISGPYDSAKEQAHNAERAAYFDHTASIRPERNRAEDCIDGSGPLIGSAGIVPSAMINRNVDLKQAQAAQRAAELVAVSQQIDYLRHRLLTLDINDEAQLLNAVVVSLMQRWVRERG